MGKWVHRLSNIDYKHRYGDCSECGSVKLKYIGMQNGVERFRCKVATGRINGSGHRPESSQVCEICRAPKNLCWDHDHKTGLFRGWLCNKCNLGIGYFYDDPYLLKRAAEYIHNN